jgi:mRNA interferase MazF
MKRGDVWTVSGGPDYTGKPRPVVIVQDDLFSAIASVTVCGLTSLSVDVPIVRASISPSPVNGLLVESFLLADKITSVPRKRLGRCIGRLEAEDLRRLDAALIVFLGLAGGVHEQA